MLSDEKLKCEVPLPELETPTPTPTTSSSDDDREKHGEGGVAFSPELKLDPNGLPLVPQPSRFKDDPLNWPAWLKWVVLLQVSFMAFLGPYNAALINPSLVLLSRAMKVNAKTAAYSTTTAIIMGGISPFIWTPFTNYYGRRPVTLLAILVTIAGAIGSGQARNFGVLVGTRAICGFGFGGMMSVGTSCVNDMFFLHERGEKTGVYSVFVTNGAHVAALIGGFLGQSASWEWDYNLGAISTVFSFILAIFLFPETLFSRDPIFLSQKTHERTYKELLFYFRGNMIPGRTLHLSTFTHPLRLLYYPSITLPFIYYFLTWTLVNVLPAITLASIYSTLFKLPAGTIGACLGLSLTIGSLLGELSAGRLSDILMTNRALRQKTPSSSSTSPSSSSPSPSPLPTHESNDRIPEHRLHLTLLSALTTPTGLLIFGLTLPPRTHSFYIPLLGLATSSFGLQIASTCLYAYVSDCYRPLTPEAGVLFNLARGLSFVVGFFALPLAARIGYAGAWGVFAGVLVLGWGGIAALIFWGEGWRRRLGRGLVMSSFISSSFDFVFGD